MRLTFFFLALYSGTLWAQRSTPQIDVLPTPAVYQRIMGVKKLTAAHVDTLVKLCLDYRFINQDSCLALGQKAVTAGKTLRDQTAYAAALLALGDAYRLFGQLPAAERLLKEGRELCAAQGNDTAVADADNKLGALQKNRGDNEAAIAYYFRALETWQRLKDSLNIIKPLINIGAAFNSQNRQDKALEYYDKALAWAAVIKDDRATMYVLNNQALIYHGFAQDYQEKGKTYPEKGKVMQDSFLFYMQKASVLYDRTLLMARGQKDKSSIIRSLMNMADLNTSIGKYEESLILSREAEGLLKELGAIGQQVQNEVNMAEAYRLLGQIPVAIAHAKAGLQLATENNLAQHQAMSNYQLYKAYQGVADYANALRYLEDYWAYQEDVNNIEKNSAIATVEARYLSAQQENKILEQQNDILALGSAKLKVERQRNITYGALFFMGILGFFGYRLNQAHKERNDRKAFAEALIFAQEEERKRIGRDLHDGIGQSLLLIKKQMEATHSTTEENQTLITETLEEVRAISQDLHPFQLEKFGVTEAIQDALRKVAASTALFITDEIENIDGMLLSKAEIHLFRSIQEALTNVVKHAEASAAKVTIRAMPKTIMAMVEDNGKGFDHELTIAKSKTMGLRTMHERITALGGQMTLAQRKPSGTVITMQIPRKINQA